MEYLIEQLNLLANLFKNHMADLMFNIGMVKGALEFYKNLITGRCYCML